MNSHLNKLLLVTAVLPLIGKQALLKQDPLSNDINKQFREQFRNEFAPNIKMKYQIGDISRIKGKAIIETEFCDEIQCKKLLVSAERRHFIWFYDDIYVNNTKNKNFKFQEFDDPIPTYYDYIPYLLSGSSFLFLMLRFIKR